MRLEGGEAVLEGCLLAGLEAACRHSPHTLSHLSSGAQAEWTGRAAQDSEKEGQTLPPVPTEVFLF